MIAHNTRSFLTARGESSILHRELNQHADNELKMWVIIWNVGEERCLQALLKATICYGVHPFHLQTLAILDLMS